MPLIAVTLSAFSLIVSIFALVVNGRRERDRWMRTEKLKAYDVLMESLDAVQASLFKAWGIPNSEHVEQVALAFGRMHGERFHAVGSDHMISAWLEVKSAMRECINWQFAGSSHLGEDGGWSGVLTGTNPDKYERECTYPELIATFRTKRLRLRQVVQDEVTK